MILCSQATVDSAQLIIDGGRAGRSPFLSKTKAPRNSLPIPRNEWYGTINSNRIRSVRWWGYDEVWRAVRLTQFKFYRQDSARVTHFATNECEYADEGRTLPGIFRVNVSIQHRSWLLFTSSWMTATLFWHPNITYSVPMFCLMRILCSITNSPIHLANRLCGIGVSLLFLAFAPLATIHFENVINSVCLGRRKPTFHRADLIVCVCELSARYCLIAFKWNTRNKRTSGTKKEYT